MTPGVVEGTEEYGVAYKMTVVDRRGFSCIVGPKSGEYGALVYCGPRLPVADSIVTTLGVTDTGTTSKWKSASSPEM